MMTAEEAAEAAKGLTFEKVWAMFLETAQRQAETDRQIKETDKQIKEMSREAELQRAETNKQIKELSKNIGGLNNSFGRWAEEMVSAKLWEKFISLGYTFTQGGAEGFLGERPDNCPGRHDA
jgi:septal ring factor EnvC (AmiA/AmiB activator)